MQDHNIDCMLNVIFIYIMICLGSENDFRVRCYYWSKWTLQTLVFLLLFFLLLFLLRSCIEPTAVQCMVVPCFTDLCHKSTRHFRTDNCRRSVLLGMQLSVKRCEKIKQTCWSSKQKQLYRSSRSSLSFRHVEAPCCPRRSHHSALYAQPYFCSFVCLVIFQ